MFFPDAEIDAVSLLLQEQEILNSRQGKSRIVILYEIDDIVWYMMHCVV